MIPKVVHYCWFGKKEKPFNVEKNINNWKKKNPDFSFIEWNENNYDILQANDFVKEAYKNKDWAFVSDYVRLFAVYKYGGFYFDTDVKLIKELNEVLSSFPNGFMGFQDEKYINTGLGFSAVPKNKVLKEMLDYYDNLQFENEDKEKLACPLINTLILEKNGLKANGKKQIVDKLIILPTEYLSPMNLQEGKNNITENTISVHEYNASWMTKRQRDRIKFILMIKKILPGKLVSDLRKLLRKKKDENKG